MCQLKASSSVSSPSRIFTDIDSQSVGCDFLNGFMGMSHEPSSRWMGLGFSRCHQSASAPPRAKPKRRSQRVVFLMLAILPLRLLAAERAVRVPVEGDVIARAEGAEERASDPGRDHEELRALEQEAPRGERAA